ncbi:polyprenyl synthetase family protein [Nakamurella silvestris]|nr:polyprenyl synthetase family protein [Nakamurella silvestris]
MQAIANHHDIPAAVGHLLQTELAVRRAEVLAIDPRLDTGVDELIRFTMNGGKRLRPQFLVCGWLAGGGSADGAAGEQAVRAAASLELIQACALLHDDIIDRSETRRGAPSAHRTMAKSHADGGFEGEAEHYGISSALILGDLALAWADDLFAEAALALDAPAAAWSAWREMRTEVLSGQLLDLRTAAANVGPAEQARDAMRVNRYKTAAYTVERPLQIGASLAGAGREVVAELRRFGVDIGIAFQLRDDLLGVFGDPSVTGKPAGDDLVEGKKTLLLATARSELAETSPALLAELDAGVGTAATPRQVDRLAGIIAGTDAVTAMEDRISELVTSGLAALDRSGIDDTVRRQLRDLAVAATQRRR